jgi:hypothetical protein
MKAIGMYTALTIRPFIPAIPASEYASIARSGARSADVVLGGHWYVDREGRILKATADAVGADLPALYSREPLSFTDDQSDWRIYRSPGAERAVRRVCAEAAIPFFMHSDAAIRFLRSRKR